MIVSACLVFSLQPREKHHTFCMEVKVQSRSPDFLPCWGQSNLEPRTEQFRAGSSPSQHHLSWEKAHSWVRPPTQAGQAQKAPWEGVTSFGFVSSLLSLSLEPSAENPFLGHSEDGL